MFVFFLRSCLDALSLYGEDVWFVPALDILSLSYMGKELDMGKM